MLRACVLDFGGVWDVYLPLAKFSYNNSHQVTIGMAPFEALYGRKCRSPVHWYDFGENKLMGPNIISETTRVVQKIRQRITVAQDRQKSYADRRRRPLEFEVEDKVFLKVSPTKGVSRFGKKNKLRPRYIGPFEILKRVGEVAYRLALPPSLANVHNVFHVSMLRKYYSDPSHILEAKAVQFGPDLEYREKPIQILDRQERKLRSRVIPMVKVLWSNHGIDEATWERESEIQELYPELF